MAGTIKMLVKSKRFYLYFGRKIKVNAKSQIEIERLY